MSKRKLQKYCNLTQAIKEYDSQLFDALDDLCLLPLLRPGPNGITFLFPEDKGIRKKIIDATYSKNPEMAVKMVKALILRSCYRKINDLQGAISNALNQVVSVSDGVWEGFKIAQAKDIDYFDHRSNISMLLLQGKGDIPINGESSPMSREKKGKQVKVEGGFNGCDCDYWHSPRVTLSNKLAKYYVNENDKKSNVYVKKVYAQLKLLEQSHESSNLFNSDKIVNYLGNEEISDSFLLDMVTPNNIFCKLLQLFGKNKDGLGEMSDDVHRRENKTYFELYRDLKDKIIKEHSKFKNQESVISELRKNKEEQENILKQVVAVCDLRESAVNAYHSKTHLGKDLFIVYTSIMKEMWETDYDMESFKHYHYMATNIYTSCDNMVDQEFNQFKDATIYGNLLKSDVFKFVPWVDVSVYSSAGYPTDKYPKPIDLSLFSLNNLVSKITSSKKGGSSSSSSLFDEYL
jgi:hypothetical protein